MGMTRKFKTVDYEATLNMTVSLCETLPPSHLSSQKIYFHIL